MITTKTFRIFISSTFSDMVHERRHLQSVVFPKLRKFCASHGAKFQAVDLRWGVNEETQQDQKTMRLCLNEIKRCQKITPKPNFIVLVGNRYGWQPVPDTIPKAEMDQILPLLNKEENMLINQWYREDTNANPPEYILQPKGEEYKEYSKWEAVEADLRNILHDKVKLLTFSEEQQRKYFTSATHQEIMLGAMQPENASKHVFAYFRNIDKLPGDISAKNYLDLQGGKIDAEAAKHIDVVKQELRSKLDPSHVYEYQANWDIKSKDINIPAIVDFGNKVYNDLLRIMSNDIQEIINISTFDSELADQKKFLDDRLEFFSGRKEILKNISDYIDDPGRNKMLCLTGPSGSGKSSVMAGAIKDASRKKNNSIIYRFAGITPDSSRMKSLFTGLCELAARELELDFKEFTEKIKEEQRINAEDQVIKSVFKGLLELAGSSKKNLIFFIDALDQINGVVSLSLASWIPVKLPACIKIIVSVIEKYHGIADYGETVHLPVLLAGTAKNILKLWYDSIHRSINTKQQSLILKNFTNNGLPIYLKICFEMAREWRSWDKHTTLADTVDGILDYYFSSLERDHDVEFVKVALGYMLAGKEGITEDELLDLFVMDQKVIYGDGQPFWIYYLQKRVFETHKEEISELKKFPIVVWSRLLFDLMPFISERNIPGGTSLVFFHRQLDEFARNRYYEPGKVRWHNNLADYFEGEMIRDNESQVSTQPLFIDEDRQNPNLRRLIEQPYQETISGQWEDLYKKTLGNYEFTEAKLKAGFYEEILGDYILAKKMDLANQLPYEFGIWESFIKNRMFMLRRGHDQWPSYKIFLQLAMEHADESPITIQAKQYLSENKVNWKWIKRKPRVKEAGIDPCITVLEGHTLRALGAKILSNGKIVSWSGDNTLRLWDQTGAQLNVMHVTNLENMHAFSSSRSSFIILELPDGGFISSANEKIIHVWDKDGYAQDVIDLPGSSLKGAILLSNGNILLWTDDGHMTLWSSGMKLMKKLKGHTKKIIGALALRDQRFLTWSHDSTAMIWNNDGKNFCKLEKLADSISGGLELSDNNLLTWSGDKTLNLWAKDGHLLKNFKKHSDSVTGALEFNDGRLLSWSDDKTLKIWSQKGILKSTLKGHESAVKGALVLPTNQILSWSNENYLILWNDDGTITTKLEGHTKSIKGALALPDGDIVTWAGYQDPIIRIWDSKGSLTNVLTGHSFLISNVLSMSNGQLLSCAYDTTLRIWNKNTINKGISTLAQHALPVDGFTVLSDGNFITFSPDNTLRLWNKEGKQINILDLPEKKWIGICELQGNRIMAWNGSAITWDYKNDQVVHFDDLRNFDGFVELSDGNIVTWNTFWDEGDRKRRPGRGKIDAKQSDAPDRIKKKVEVKQFDQNGKHLTDSDSLSQWISRLAELCDGFYVNWTSHNKLTVWKYKQRGWQISEEDKGACINGSSFASLQPVTFYSNDDKFLIENPDDNLKQRITDIRNHIENNIEIKCINSFIKDKNAGSFFKRFDILPIDIPGTKEYVEWHGKSILESMIFVDGGAIATQFDGQVCLLETFDGSTNMQKEELK